MLLETLDVRKNDVLIFSQNQFDFETNFKIVFKKQADRRPRKITYFEVCEFIKDPSPKNIILYRLLTNVESLDAYSTKYGYFINLAGKMELVYFDPVFAIKDLRHLRFNIDPDRFRFKIQQIGVNFDSARDSEAVYKEVYSFDLTADEAQYQNDKIFADAIFVFDDSYHGESFLTPEPKEPQNVAARKFNSEEEHITDGGIEEVEEKSHPLKKVDFTGEKDTNTERDKKVDLLKMALGISESNDNIKEFHKEKEEEDSSEKYGETNVFDLFKTTSKTSLLSNRDKDNIILKIKNS